MMRHFITATECILLALSAGLSPATVCHGDEIPDAEEKKLDEKMEKAGQTITYNSDGKRMLTFHCYYPTSYAAGRNLPLLILFSPGGQGERIQKKFIAAGEVNSWIVVGCDGFKNRVDEELGEEMFTEVLHAIEKKVVHDKDLVYMGGMSGGAWRAYHYSVLFDRPWKGIVACGGWLGGPEYKDLAYPEKMAVAIINGNEDKGANHWIDHDREILKGRRIKVRVFHFQGGHSIAPDETLTKAIQWMVATQADQAKLEHQTETTIGKE